MMQIAQSRLPLLPSTAVDNGAPTQGSVTAGIEMTRQRSTSKHAVEIAAGATGAVTYDAYLWGLSGLIWTRHRFDDTTLADIGHVNDGLQITGQLTGSNTFHFRRVFPDLGYLDRIYLQILNSAGTARTFVGTLIPIEET